VLRLGAPRFLIGFRCQHGFKKETQLDVDIHPKSIQTEVDPLIDFGAPTIEPNTVPTLFPIFFYSQKPKHQYLHSFSYYFLMSLVPSSFQNDIVTPPQINTKFDDFSNLF